MAKKKIDPKVEETKDTEFQEGEIPTDNQATEVDDTPEAPEDTALQLETQVEDTVVHAVKHPSVHRDICEFCGVPYYGAWFYGRAQGSWRPAKEGDKPSDVVRCKHYNHLHLKCSYCKVAPQDNGRKLVVFSLPEKPNILICVCDDYNCIVAHEKRFNIKR